MATDRRYQAHPVSPVPGYPWPVPSRRRRAQYALAVFAQTAILGAGFLGILVALGLAATLVGVDPSAGVTR